MSALAVEIIIGNIPAFLKVGSTANNSCSEAISGRIRMPRHHWSQVGDKFFKAERKPVYYVKVAAPPGQKLTKFPVVQWFG